jgi:glycosyltransferase involved in cell wall biosynthesis
MHDRSKPRVAVVTDAIAPWHRGGKETYYSDLVVRLTEQFEVHVYTMKWWDGPSTFRDGEVTYHAISPKRSLYSGGRRSIRQAVMFAVCCLRLLFAPFDVIQADHMPYMQLFPLRLVATLRRTRLVAIWHECWGPEYWRSYLGQAGRIGWLIESLAMRLPDVIIAASPLTADRLTAFTRGRIEVITATPGIDVGAFSKIEAAGDATDVITVGRLLPHKRVDLLLQALATLRDEGRPLTARVIGSGPQLAALMEEARSLGLAESVEFRQDISDQRALYAALKAARVAVFPSQREGFGIAVLEALGCGVPVVTTNAPENYAQRLLRNREHGSVCEPTARDLADTIARMLDQNWAGTVADQEWLQSYDWSSIAQSVMAALR